MQSRFGLVSAHSNVHIADGRWHRFTAAFVGGTISLVVDGQKENEAAGTLQPAASNNLIVGGDACCSEKNFQGQLRQIEVLNRAATEEDKQQSIGM